jgi:hypothetical protein
MFYVLLPDEGGLRTKHVGENIICIYALYMKAVDFNTTSSREIYLCEDVLQATFANMERRVQLCLDSGGEHF